MPIPIVVFVVVAGTAVLGGLGYYGKEKAEDVYQKVQAYEELKIEYEALKERSPMDADNDEWRQRIRELEAEITELEQAVKRAEDDAVKREREEQEREIRGMLE